MTRIRGNEKYTACFVPKQCGVSFFFSLAVSYTVGTARFSVFINDGPGEEGRRASAWEPPLPSVCSCRELDGSAIAPFCLRSIRSVRRDFGSVFPWCCFSPAFRSLSLRGDDVS